MTEAMESGWRQPWTITKCSEKGSDSQVPLKLPLPMGEGPLNPEECQHPCTKCRVPPPQTQVHSVSGSRPPPDLTPPNCPEPMGGGKGGNHCEAPRRAGHWPGQY